MTTFLVGMFVMAACCYLLFVTSDPLERVGGRLGHLLHLPEDVIASTFQALATSGPEITMAILASTSFIAANAAWDVLTLEERSCSGCLNLCFSAMSNLLGIGCLGMIFMVWKKYVKSSDTVIVAPSVRVGLLFYVVSSALLATFVQVSSFRKEIDGREIVAHTLSSWQAWVLMGTGIAFVISQFFLPGYLRRRYARQIATGQVPKPPQEDNDHTAAEDPPLPRSIIPWTKDLLKNGFIYAFLVYALVIFVRECLGATFNMASIGLVSVGGVLIMFTSYVSSFPEFMMTYRYAVANKKSALLGMLFGSNVIDLAFAGFGAVRTGESMEIYTTGNAQFLFPLYLWCLPAIALLSLVGLARGWLRYWHAYPLLLLYVFYVLTGFVLL